MGLLGKILKTGIHIATSPIDIISDVVTLGGTLSDSEPAITRKAGKITNDINEIENEVDNL